MGEVPEDAQVKPEPDRVVVDIDGGVDLSEFWNQVWPHVLKSWLLSEHASLFFDEKLGSVGESGDFKVRAMRVDFVQIRHRYIEYCLTRGVGRRDAVYRFADLMRKHSTRRQWRRWVR